MQRRRVRRVPVTGPQSLLVGQLQALAQLIGEQVKADQMLRP